MKKFCTFFALCAGLLFANGLKADTSSDQMMAPNPQYYQQGAPAMAPNMGMNPHMGMNQNMGSQDGSMGCAAGNFQGQAAGGECCPAEEPVGDCYCLYRRYKACPYYTCNCEYCPKYSYTRCCRQVPQNYCVTRCRMVPQYYQEQCCRQVPQYYYTCQCTHCPKYTYTKCCRYVPEYYYKHECKPNCCGAQGCCAQ